MKIGFFSPYLDTFGGGERYMLTLASYLSQKNSVDVFWNDANIKAQLSRFLKIDLTKTRFTKNIFGTNFFNSLYLTRGYDLIFFLSDGTIPSTFAKKNILHFQVPFHGINLDIKSRLKLKRFKWVVANSLFTKSFIDEEYNVDSLVIYPPVDIRNIKQSRKENIIVSVGRFSAKQLHPKKQEVLIEVFKEVYKKKPDWRLVLVGQAKKEDLKYLRVLKKASKGFGIKIMENLQIEELRSFYARSSIYWHATGFGEDEMKFPQKMEHFGISTVEAQAAGAVPVVIGKGGQKEIVVNNKNGFLWQTKSQLLESTLRLINDPSLKNKLSQAAVKNSKRFSQEKFIKEYEKIIFQ